MYNIGAFLIGVFLLVCGRLAWKQTPEEHWEFEFLKKTAVEGTLPFWAVKPVGIICILLGTILIFASIIITIKF